MSCEEEECKEGQAVSQISPGLHTHSVGAALSVDVLEHSLVQTQL